MGNGLEKQTVGKKLAVVFHANKSPVRAEAIPLIQAGLDGFQNRIKDKNKVYCQPGE